MTFKQLQDEVILRRFNENYRASIKSWLNTRYSAIWALDDWHFKHVKGAALAVTAGDASPTMPSDFGKSEGLYDQRGDRLRFLAPNNWRDRYLDPTVSAIDPPYDYTVVAREIWLGPAPSVSRTFTLAYERRLSHVDSGTGLAAAGVMVNDGDQPIWEAEYDYLLVIDACILGQQMTQDPTWRELVPQRDELLASLREDLIGGQDGERAIWGAGC